MGLSIVIGVLQDIHHLGLRVLAYALDKAGFHVVDVGAGVSQEDLIAAALETAASAILVSSSNGLAEIDCRGLRERCVEAGIGDIVLYAGGNVVVQQQARDWADVERSFRKMGFTRVYATSVHPSRVIEDLRSDLAEGASALRP
jgi:methylaspartate mutase sigma subunit